MPQGRRPMRLVMCRAATLILLAFSLLCVPADAIVRLPADLRPVPGNPANRLAALPIEDSTYDHATRCSRKRRPGMEAFAAWLQRHAEGASWGTYRCERWGRRSASLHAEGRALDWHLDAAVPAQRREARRLIVLLLAPDTAGNPQALARRMGVQEIIWDCGYWAAGMQQFGEYRPCFNKHGRRRRHVSPTIAHRDHIHFGLTHAAVAARTSFWDRG